MTTLLRALAGDPGTVISLAGRLAGQGELLLAMAATLRGLADPDTATWDSPAGAAFAARARTGASLLTSVGRRYAVAGVALRPLAAALAEAQVDVGWAVIEREDAWTRAVDLGNRRVAAEESADPAERAAAAHLHREEIAQLERVQLAERRHAAGWQRYAEADRRCATVLHGLVQDGLDDSRTYDTLTGLGRGAGAVGDAVGTLALFPTFRPLIVVAEACDAVQVAADVTVKVGYGDGDWGTIALIAGASASGPLSDVLKRGSLATNPAALLTGTRSARRLLRYDTPQRLRIGIAGAGRAGRIEPKPGARIFKATRAPGSPRATALWAKEQVLGRSRVFLRNKWFDDLALVTGDPARSRTMMVTGLGAEATSAGLSAGSTVREWHQGHQDRSAMQARDDAADKAPEPDPATKGPVRPR